MQVCDKLLVTEGAKDTKDTLPAAEIKEVSDKMSNLSWKFLTMVPPLISQTISDAPFCKEWHEKEIKPEWNENLVDYQLVYYRPILFFSYQGKVAKKSWVGNTVYENDNGEIVYKDTKVGKKGKTAAVSKKTFLRKHFKSYKKPVFKTHEAVGASSEGAYSTPSKSSQCPFCCRDRAIEANIEDFSLLDHQLQKDDTEEKYIFGIKNFS